MYSILMDSNKYLTATKTQVLYQGENYVDTLYFILPCTYSGYDIGTWTCTLTILYPTGEVDFEILSPEEDKYKDLYYRYPYVAKTSNLTRYPGEVKLGLKLNHVDTEQLIQYSLTTSDITIKIEPTSSIYSFTDSSLNKIDQLIGKLDAHSQYLGEIAEQLTMTQVNDLAFDEEGTLHVSANTKLLGDGVNVVTPTTDDDEDGTADGIIDLDTIYKEVSI